MDFSPGFLLLLLFFLLSPLILGGKMTQKSASVIASLMGAVFAMVPVLIIYFIIVSAMAR